jgi:hypothetical protein
MGNVIIIFMINRLVEFIGRSTLALNSRRCFQGYPLLGIVDINKNWTLKWIFLI